MPNPVNFDGRQVIEPGWYNAIKGDVASPATIGSFGNVMIIDTGSGKDFGGGSGILGELATGDDTIYEIDSAVDFKRFVRGGRLYDIVEYLMSPSNQGPRPNKIFYARAATTVSAKITFTFPNTAGAVTIAAKNEGPGGNGILTGNVVSIGYGAKIKAGIVDSTAYFIDFYEGLFRGLDENGVPYDGIAQAEVTQNLVARSPEFKTAAQFLAWAQSDATFKRYFTISASTTSNTNINVAVLTTYAAVQLFSGGTCVYSSTALDTLLESIIDLDNSMFLCDDYGVTPSTTGQQIQDGINKGALSAFNQKILAHCINDASNKLKALYIGGGKDESEYQRAGTFDGSEDIASFYNSPLVHVIHSDVKVPSTLSNTGQGFKYLPALYGAAMVCGRTAGLEPQDPTTYKGVRIIGVKHNLKLKQRERALLHGVIHFKKVNRLGYVINQMINTMQKNSAVVYNDGTSPETSIMRIAHQLNKEISEEGTVRFPGGNLATSSAEEVKLFVETQLQTRTSSQNVSRLIQRYEKVTVELVGDSWQITYCFVPNGPINRIFSTGFMIDPNIKLA